MNHLPLNVKTLIFRDVMSDSPKETILDLACVCKDWKEVISKDAELRRLSWDLIEWNRAGFYVARVHDDDAAHWKCRSCYHTKKQRCGRFMMFGIGLPIRPIMFYHQGDYPLFVVSLPAWPICILCGVMFLCSGLVIESCVCCENKCKCNLHSCCEVLGERHLQKHIMNEWVIIPSKNCSKCRLCW